MQKGGFFMNNQELNFMMNEMSRIPYPAVANIRPNDKFGRLVYDAYAGSQSELTTILTYVFEDLTNREKEEVAMLLGIISKQDMLNFNIEMEKGAIKGYQHLVDVCEEDNIKAVITRIIMDEECHVQIFEYLKGKYCGCEKCD